MKKGLILLLVLGMATGCTKQQEVKENIIYEVVVNEHEDDYYYMIGDADYVFIGKVEEVITSDASIPDSEITITVIDSYKRKLHDHIKVTYHGGYSEEGDLVLRIGDFIQDIIYPQVGETYIFVGNALQDGSIELYDLIGVNQEDRIDEFIDYLNHEINVERERYTSIYEG